MATWLKLPFDSIKFSFGNGARAIGGGVVGGRVGAVVDGNIGAAVGGWVGRGATVGGGGGGGGVPRTGGGRTSFFCWGCCGFRFLRVWGANGDNGRNPFKINLIYCYDTVLLQMSISSMFYVRIFHTKVFSLLIVWLWTNFRTKNAFVKCWWNWLQASKSIFLYCKQTLVRQEPYRVHTW